MSDISSAGSILAAKATGDATPLDIRLLEQEAEAEADRFVKDSPTGTLFHLSGWKRIVERSLNRRCFWLAARREGRICGVFPVSLARSRIFGDALVSVPLAVYGGICADDKDAHYSLLEAGKDLAVRMRVQYLEMRNREEQFPTSLPGRDLYCTFTQDLSPGAEKLFKALPRDTRYAVRKGQKAGLSWTEDLSDDEFYEIYAQSVRNLGTPVFPRALFRACRDEFGQACRLFGVRKEKRAIAGVLCFYFRDQVMPYYGGSMADCNRDAPNNFMYWSLIAQSCGEGYRIFDFGRSKRGTGAFHFKSSWGMQVSELPYRYQLVRAKEVPHLSPVDKKFQLPVELWKRLPLSWTKILGPPLIRRIPSI